MRERIGAERQQPELHAAGQVVAAAREVRPAQRRRRADRGHHVEDQRQVQHLFNGNAGQHLTPAGHRGGLFRGQPVLRPGLQAEARVQVLAHDQVLDLSRLGEQVPQVLTMLNDDNRLGHLRHDSSLAPRWLPEAAGIRDGRSTAGSPRRPPVDQRANWRRQVTQIISIRSSDHSLLKPESTAQAALRATATKC
jgi:hypothetical protein